MRHWTDRGVALQVVILVLGLVVALASAAEADFIRGDVNEDGVIDVADPVAELQAIFVPGSDPLGCPDAGDVNDDGAIDVSDPIYLLSHLFVPGDPPPPPPFPTAGPDPTPDPLGDCGPVSWPFEVVVEGTSCGAPPQDTIMRTQAEFDAFWLQYGSIYFPPPPQPVIDFDQEMVVALVRAYTSGGYFVSIDELQVTPAGVEIHYTFGAPMSGCPVLTVLTQPHSIVRCAQAPGDPIPIQDATVDTCP